MTEEEKKDFDKLQKKASDARIEREAKNLVYEKEQQKKMEEEKENPNEEEKEK